MKKLVGVVVAVLLVGGVGVWWFVLRDDPPAELSVDSGSDSSSKPTTGTTPATLDGTWTVQADGDSQAGFRITESFAGGLADHEAVGRSSAVTGSVEVSGTTVTDGSFTVDLTAIEFTDDPGLPVANRVRAMQQRGLETARFPEATFELTEPVELGTEPADGDTVTATATGELTLHGVTRPVEIPVEVKVDGGTVRIATADPVPVALADHDITPPTGGPIAEVSDTGSFEFLVVLEPA